MTDKNRKLTKEEKIQKAKNLLKEVASLELTDEELENVSGGGVISQKEVKELLKPLGLNEKQLKVFWKKLNEKKGQGKKQAKDHVDPFEQIEVTE